MTPRDSCSGRLPRPRPGEPDVPRLGRDGADRAAGDRGDGRVLPEYRATIHRGVYPLAARATDAYEGARERVAAFAGSTPGETVFTRNATEAINLVAYSLGPGQRRRRRPRASSRRWSTTPTSCRGSCCAPRRARSWPTCRSPTAGLLDMQALGDLLARRPKLLAVAPRLQRARHGQPDRRDRRARARRRRARAGRRRAGRPAPAGRRRRARRRLLRLDRPQGLRADRHRRAARPPRAARGDAAVPRRRAHDHPRRRLRVPVRRAARALRGGHHADRRGDRPRRRRRLPVRARDGRRVGALARRHRLRRRAPAVASPGLDAPRPGGARPPRQPLLVRLRAACTRTTSPRSSAARASASAPATTAPSR